MAAHWRSPVIVQSVRLGPSAVPTSTKGLGDSGEPLIESQRNWILE